MLVKKNNEDEDLKEKKVKQVILPKVYRTLGKIVVDISHGISRSSTLSISFASSLIIFYFIIIAILFVVILPILSVFNDELNSRLITKTPLFVRLSFEFIDQIYPITISCLSGMLGCIVKNYCKNFYDNNYKIPKKLLIISAVMGGIGYALIQSKILLKLVYPKIDAIEATPTFLSIVLVGFGFGIFATEFIGISRNAFEKQFGKHDKIKPQNKRTTRKRTGNVRTSRSPKG